MSDLPGAPVEADWQRLDRRSMLVGPLKTLRQFLVPMLAGLIGLGTQQPQWLLFAAPVVVGGAVAIGVLPWVTTRFRVADDHLVVTRGLINRTRLTAPLERIRSVDLEAPLLHRLLSIEKVEIGTGVDDTMIELDSLSKVQAEELRGFLLTRAASMPADDAASPAPTGADPAPGSAPLSSADLARFERSWVRFAPFSLGRLVIALGALGGLSQFVGDVDVSIDQSDVQRIESALLLIVVALVVGGLVVWTLLSMAAYAVQWWGLRLFREHGNLRLTRGLFTTSSTTIEEARVRGVRLRETALLRLVGGAELHTLVTGLDESVYAVLPPSPAAAATRVGADILGDEAPLIARLVRHGGRARRRCHLRGVRLLAPAVVVALLAVLFVGSTPWLPIGVAVIALLLGGALGEAEYHHLGHAVTDHHLVAGSGVTSRVRTVLERAGIIGWVVSQSWFQRRRGLATLIATTAAGEERVTVRDVPLPQAIAFADAAVPGMLEAFTVRPEHPGPAHSGPEPSGR
ncbi:PH domain-containing protein [Nocardioides jensenii]|uniref:PH domain-containing protein n=1 Tax=Nocardioides jensenii TaxID=1843 RepID=UPI00082DF53E|nr:PH domain-containing protein [Nocardioides jensenii]